MTWLTWSACCSTVRFLWITPMPPSIAIAIAIGASVTVSIAAERNGMLRRMREVRRVDRSVESGRKSAYCRTSDTSS